MPNKLINSDENTGPFKCPSLKSPPLPTTSERQANKTTENGPLGEPHCSKKEEKYKPPEEETLFEWPGTESRSPSPIYDLEKIIEEKQRLP